LELIKAAVHRTWETDGRAGRVDSRGWGSSQSGCVVGGKWGKGEAECWLYPVNILQGTVLAWWCACLQHQKQKLWKACQKARGLPRKQDLSNAKIHVATSPMSFLCLIWLHSQPRAQNQTNKQLGTHSSTQLLRKLWRPQPVPCPVGP
jgi:hypothetical protein